MKKLPTSFKVNLSSDEFIEILHINVMEIEHTFFKQVSYIVMHHKLVRLLEEKFYHTNKPYMHMVNDPQTSDPPFRRAIMGITIITTSDIGENEVKLIIE